MNQREIIEGDTTISLFMDWAFFPEIQGIRTAKWATAGTQWEGLLPPAFHYHWELLMPVVLRIEKEYHKKERTPEEVVAFSCVTGLLICAPIEIVWQAVVIFLNWYNIQSK